MTKLKKSTLIMAGAAGALLFAVPELSLVTEAQAETASKTYIVAIETSDIKRAGTNADVKITLFGTNSRSGSGARLLDNKRSNDFTRDSISVFAVKSKTDLGPITKIQLEHDDGGISPGWHVGNVAVFEPESNAYLPADYKGKLGQGAILYGSGIDASETTLSGNDLVSPSYTEPYVSYYNFNTWIASDEGSNENASGPWDDRLRADYDNFTAKMPNNYVKGEGEWEAVCINSPVCTSDRTIGKIAGIMNATEKSDEYWAALTVGFSTSTNTVPGTAPNNTFSTEIELGAKFRNAETQGTNASNSVSFSCGTEIDMVAAGAGAVWQWVTTDQFFGEEFSLSECVFTCTERDNRPNYDAGDDQQWGTCNPVKDQPVRAPRKYANTGGVTPSGPAGPSAKTTAKFLPTRNAAISGENRRKIKGSIEQCETACIQETEFLCKSFDYNKSYKSCDLSDMSASDVVGGLKTNYRNNPYDYYERVLN